MSWKFNGPNAIYGFASEQYKKGDHEDRP